jgi:hypothetical protein
MTAVRFCAAHSCGARDEYYLMRITHEGPPMLQIRSGRSSSARALNNDLSYLITTHFATG